jgi:hypothetical protein
MRLVSSSGRARWRPDPPPRPRPPRGWRRASPARRLAIIGLLVLVIGLLSAAGVYWVGTRRADPTLDELLPGYSRANSRQMGIFYGHLGVMMWEWREDLARPDTQAILIAVVSGLVACGCFRLAWLRNHGTGA